MYVGRGVLRRGFGINSMNSLYIAKQVRKHRLEGLKESFEGIKEQSKPYIRKNLLIDCFYM